MISEFKIGVKPPTKIPHSKVVRNRLQNQMASVDIKMKWYQLISIDIGIQNRCKIPYKNNAFKSSAKSPTKSNDIN